MKDVVTTLLADLKKEINHIPEKRNTIRWLEKARTIALTKLESLKEKMHKHTFKSQEDEINFFKNQKPLLLAKVIEMEIRFKLESRKAPGTQKEQKEYYQNEIKKINRYFIKNSKQYQQIKSTEVDKNKKYFLRNRKHYNSISTQMDDAFTTQMDFKAAKFIAMKKVKRQLLKKIGKKKIVRDTKSSLEWTGTKVALVELVYALNSAGVVNNGKASLNDTVQVMQTMFNTEIGQFNRIYLEIKARKTERTKFLNTLQTNLITRMNQADEK